MRNNAIAALQSARSAFDRASNKGWDKNKLASDKKLRKDLQVELKTLQQDLGILVSMATIGAYIFLVFGFLSRRCERQADLYGCRAVSCFRKDCFDHATDQGIGFSTNNIT